MLIFFAQAVLLCHVKARSTLLGASVIREDEWGKRKLEIENPEHPCGACAKAGGGGCCNCLCELAYGCQKKIGNKISNIALAY